MWDPATNQLTSSSRRCARHHSDKHCYYCDKSKVHRIMTSFVSALEAEKTMDDIRKFDNKFAPNVVKSVNNVFHVLSFETLPNYEFPRPSEKMRLRVNILLKSTAEDNLLQEHSYMHLTSGSMRKNISPIQRKMTGVCSNLVRIDTNDFDGR